MWKYTFIATAWLVSCQAPVDRTQWRVVGSPPTTPAPASPKRFSPEKTEKVRLSMTEKEVRDLFGAPDSVSIL